ncbi:ABC transporter permease [Paenibacillus albiflavus]|uniref:ABC transporter permease n=1 Tax=Paenibacillus albiflavus TaxID=2545760 RepID=A0A4R4E4D7_9BACL|nr:ABC transporter permease [Paenibacillus albiflavus]TCZ73570.1 ABC transporter permease [Paenibacillus albiflavus]
MLEYMVHNYARIWTLLIQHLLLTLSTLGIALVIAVPVGLFLNRYKWISVPVLSLLGILYSIPSLAMYAFLIPLIGLGAKTAIVALVAYSQLILVRNVMVGFQSIDSAIIEAGRGMGLDAKALFVYIQLPLALPLILGGLRLATVSTIGIATIAAWINAGGLGVILFEGLYQNHMAKMLWGTIMVSVLAIAANQLLMALERRMSRRARGELV